MSQPHAMVSASPGLSHFSHVGPLYTEERDFEKANGMLPLLEAMATVGLESLVVRPDRKRFV